MTTEKSARWAAVSALVALAGSVTFWILLAVAAASMGSFQLTDLGTIIVLLAGIGTVINIAALVAIAAPALSGTWSAHQHGLAVLGAVGMGSLFVFYLPVVATLAFGALNTYVEGAALDFVMLLVILMALATLVAVPAALVFAVATASALGRGTAGRMRAGAA